MRIYTILIGFLVILSIYFSFWVKPEHQRFALKILAQMNKGEYVSPNLYFTNGQRERIPNYNEQDFDDARIIQLCGKLNILKSKTQPFVKYNHNFKTVFLNSYFDFPDSIANQLISSQNVFFKSVTIVNDSGYSDNLWNYNEIDEKHYKLQLSYGSNFENYEAYFLNEIKYVYDADTTNHVKMIDQQQYIYKSKTPTRIQNLKLLFDTKEGKKYGIMELAHIDKKKWKVVQFKLLATS